VIDRIKLLISRKLHSLNFQSLVNVIFLSPHWLNLPIGQTPPSPFKRAKPEKAKPDVAVNDLNCPYGSDYIVDFIPFKLTIIAQANPVKKQATHCGLHQIIGKCHLTHRAQQFKKPLE
jgi:hypothetical protein